MRWKIGLLSLVWCLKLALPADAAVMSTHASDFAVFSGANFSTGQNVTIKGMVGAGNDFNLGNNGVITGNALAGGNLTIQQNGSTGNIISHSAVWLASNTQVGSIDAGRTIGLDQGARSGSLHAATDVMIYNGAQVTGSVMGGGSFYAGPGARVTQGVSYGTTAWADPQAQISGGLTKTSSPAPDTFSVTLLSKPNFKTTGSGQTYHGQNSTVHLVAGNYGELAVEQNSRITLGAGTYNFSRIYLGQDVQLIADTSAGDVIINIVNDLSSSQNNQFLDQGIGNLLIRTGGAMYLGQNSRVEGSLQSFATMTIDRNSTIAGQLYSSQNMYLSDNVVVGGAGASGVVAVPEPASATLLLAGCLMLCRRRRIEEI